VKTPYSQGVLRKQFIYVRLVKVLPIGKFPSATLALFKNDRNLSKANELCGYVNNQKVIHNSAQLSHDLKR
jgi:uncharacterized protein YeaC (DUF1315 family)